MKKSRKNENFQKTFFFAINDLMNLAGVQHQYYDTISLRRKPVHTLDNTFDTIWTRILVFVW